MQIRKEIWKIKFLIAFSLIFLLGCQTSEINCKEFCAIPERHEIFESFGIEKQFEYYRTCPCRGDSISEQYLFAREIGENKQIIDFLANKLSTENDAEILVASLELLNFLRNKNELKGRKDISALVYETIERIPEKDERSSIDKIFGDEQQSRKQRLVKLAKEFEMEILQPNDSKSSTKF